MSGYQNKRYGGGGGGGGGSQQYNNQNSRHQFYDVSEIVWVLINSFGVEKSCLWTKRTDR